MMNARKKACILLLAVFILTVSVSFCESPEPDYYRIGLNVSALMSGMADSEAYCSLFGPQEMYREVREKVNTHDYDRPVAVYSVRLTDSKSFIEEALLKDQESRNTWNSLSPALQEQVLGRFGVQSLCSIVNARMGSEYIAFCSVVTAFIREQTLASDSSGCFLYIFEKGTPILVSFGYRAASGQFLFIPEEFRESPDSIASYLGIPCLEITPVESTNADSSGML